MAFITGAFPRFLVNDQRDLIANNIITGATNFGYVTGGWRLSPTPNGAQRSIDRFPFASASNAAFVGNLSQVIYGTASQSSPTQGYATGGATNNYTATTRSIDRFPFASSSTNSTSLGNLTTSRGFASGASDSTYGYTIGGASTTTALTNVERFPFAVDLNIVSSSIGDLNLARSDAASQHSVTHAYLSGGGIGNTSTYASDIQRFPFAISGTISVSNPGNLTLARIDLGGHSSMTHGYASGGILSPTASNNTTRIDRFPFASSSVSSATVASLVTSRYGGSGNSSSVNGYSSAGLGGTTPGTAFTNVLTIERFPFAADTTTSASIGTIGTAPTARGAIYASTGQEF